MRRLIAVTLSLATWTVAVAVVSVLAAHRSAAGWWLLLIPAGLLLALAFSVALGFHGSHGGLPAFLLGQFPADPRLLPRTVHMERTGSAPTVEAQAVIDLDHPLHRVDERFLSVAVDLSQVVEGRWWDPAARHVEFSSGSLCSPRFDFDRPQLDRLTAALSPLYLRIGGSEADKVFHALDDDPAIPPGYQSVLTRSQWDRITAFCQRNDCRLVFTLNAGPGARQANGNWDPRNAEALFAHAAQGPHVDVWELGNELNVFFFVHGLRDQVPVDQYCRDLHVLRRQIDRLSPGSQLAGQGSAFWPALGEPLSWFFGYSREMLRQAGDLLDLFTWHYYPQQSRRCVMGSRRAHPARLLDPSALDEAAHWATCINTWRDTYAPGLPVWLGETGNAQCGGAPGLSDTYLAGLWWLDQLGLMARLKQQVVVRQSLTGMDYGLLDEETLAPRPDYWNSLLWRRLMGPTVYPISLRGPDKLRLYAHLAADRSGICPLAINLDHLRSIHLDLPQLAGAAGEQILLSSPDVLGGEVRLNGVALEVGTDGRPPPTPGKPLRAGEGILLPPLSYGFLIYGDR